MTAVIPFRAPETLASVTQQCRLLQRLVREAGRLCTADAPDEVWDAWEQRRDELEQAQARLRRVTARLGGDADHMLEALS